ncbi:hypothetical protein GM3708_3025 [Geminocystis sp. NIES-3708]|uniref:flavohemoglobin expression-modulating QEGLA motif protein n=1 Tax=Geminocystis sp. NIES-3708 TaxID=1615909 RepID=UPI0005FC5204|nr:flavohemoglobin expression-modulating QEGLA motif protein [Geminocystis sp. NIES-3708]BAQ62619.1 hypothetical protein GM3708_3025 [Geminocystis sp. NIES-3708]
MSDLHTEKEKVRICSVASLLQQANKQIRILKTISWNPQVKEDFFAHQCQKLPDVNYIPFNPAPVIDILREARKNIFPQSSKVDFWLERQGDAIEKAARMLANVGKSDFFSFSRLAYGEPTAPLRYDDKTLLQLAQSIRDNVDRLNELQFKIHSPTIYSAEEIALKIDLALKPHFGEDAPEIVILDNLSANALATSKQIRLRRDAKFTDRDCIQLINHEGFIHVLTSINGKKQDKLPILGEGHIGTTCTQEGLAVFAEVISGSMELNRFQRLADRVFAIQMAIDGADFIDVYKYFFDRTEGKKDQSFESARRVFRGGVITGSTPFTKDVVYLFGLLMVSSAINAMFSAGRADCLRLMFCGKLDIMDLPALAELTDLGLCKLPKYLPPWIIDPRSLLALLTYSTFMRKIDLDTSTKVASRLLGDTPIINCPLNLEAPT